MNRTKILSRRVGLVICSLLFGTLAGCIGYVERPRREVVHVHSPPPVIVVQDDYVYYPGYEVYYSRTRRHYVYRDGRSWVTRPAPPRVSVEVLVASPSVRVDFHDAPSAHHERIVKQYPKHWAPSKGAPNRGEGNRDRDDGKGKDKDKDGGGRK
jgi:hypothetical protein